MVADCCAVCGVMLLLGRLLVKTKPTNKLITLAEDMDTAATKGPWKSDYCGDVWTISPDVPLEESMPEIGVLFRGVGSTSTGPDCGDGKFIAASRTAWPATAKALRRAIEFIQAEDECSNHRMNGARDCLDEIDRIAAEVVTDED